MVHLVVCWKNFEADDTDSSVISVNNLSYVYYTLLLNLKFSIL